MAARARVWVLSAIALVSLSAAWSGAQDARLTDAGAVTSFAPPWLGPFRGGMRSAEVARACGSASAPRDTAPAEPLACGPFTLHMKDGLLYLVYALRAELGSTAVRDGGALPPLAAPPNSARDAGPLGNERAFMPSLPLKRARELAALRWWWDYAGGGWIDLHPLRDDLLLFASAHLKRPTLLAQLRGALIQLERTRPATR